MAGEHAYTGSNITYRPPLFFDTYAHIPTPSAIGVGLVIAGGRLYWCTGSAIVDAIGFSAAPAAANSTGTAGQVAVDSGYIYICTATNTWKRVAIATWP